MTRCNGSFSREREIPEKRTRVGKTDPSARRERDCCDVFVRFCGEVDDKALAQLLALPEFHSDWELSR